MGTSTKWHLGSQTSTYLGYKRLAGKILIGAINVVNNTPMKTTTNVSVTYTSKKLFDGNDIFNNHK